MGCESCCCVLNVFDNAASDGIVVGVETMVVSPGVRMVFGVCNRVGCCVAVVMIVGAGLIVVDEMSRGPSDFIAFTTEAFVTVIRFVAADAILILDDAALPSLFIEKTM